jgi:hypothetical protein
VDAYLRQHITHSPDDMSLESDGGMILTGENRTTRRKTCPSATLSTTNPTWTDLGAKPGIRGERPAANDLSQIILSGLYNENNFVAARNLFIIARVNELTICMLNFICSYS